MNDLIAAFSFDIARGPAPDKKLFIYFKVLPMPNVDLEQIWKTHYLNPTPISSIDVITTVYMPRELILSLKDLNIQVQCEHCYSPTLLENKKLVCFNMKCVEFNRDSLMKRLSLGSKLLNYDDLDFKKDEVECRKCQVCITCKRRKSENKDKCFRHKVCRHRVFGENHYRTLNNLTMVHTE